MNSGHWSSSKDLVTKSGDHNMCTLNFRPLRRLPFLRLHGYYYCYYYHCYYYITVTVTVIIQSSVQYFLIIVLIIPDTHTRNENTQSIFILFSLSSLELLLSLSCVVNAVQSCRCASGTRVSPKIDFYTLWKLLYSLHKSETISLRVKIVPIGIKSE